MERAKITLTSCSGETTFELDVTQIEKGMLRRMVKESQKETEGCCQPWIEMEMVK